jgi:hypothetical protein
LAPSAARRFISHSSSNTAGSATLQLQHAGQQALPSPRPWLQSSLAGTSPAAAAAARSAVLPAEAALTAAAAAFNSSTSRSTAVAKRPGFLATAGLIYRQEGASAFSRGIQVCVACNKDVRG